MRAKYLFTLLAFMVLNCAKAQQYGSQWAIGYGESLIDFRNGDTVIVHSEPLLEGFILTNACICDEKGNFLYYTNGVYICSLSDTISGGLDLCQCSSDDSIDGLDIPQAAIFIPQPGNNRYYYLFHFWDDTYGGTRPSTIYYSLIDREGNGGAGAVTKKNVPIISGQLLRDGGMTACKHANGRDYWLIMGQSNSNAFYKFLITPDSIIGPMIQHIGIDFPVEYDVMYSKFSQDGSKFATGGVQSLILLMDFDRCTGEFSNPQTIFNNDAIDTAQQISGSVAMEFSPNGRFLYVSGVTTLNQYDLWAGNIQDSMTIFSSPVYDLYQLDFLQLGPNGKLYASTWGGRIRSIACSQLP